MRCVNEFSQRNRIQEPHRETTMRRWLARLSFSFIIIACVLAYEAYKTMHAQESAAAGPRAMLLAAGAAVAFALGVAGVRERHRPG